MHTDKLGRINTRPIPGGGEGAVAIPTSRKALKIRSESGPAATGGIPFSCEIITVAVETMSVNPVMICCEGLVMKTR